MKRLMIILAGIVCLTIGEIVVAATDVKISGQVRWRSELSKEHFGDGWRSYEYLRSRVAINAIMDSSTTAFIQFQDSRQFGTTNYPASNSGNTRSAANVDLHQAYIKTRIPLSMRSTIAVGRFEFKVGNERIFGIDDWDNVAQSFNGVQLMFAPGFAELTGFALYGEQVQEYNWTLDQQIWGITVEPPGANLNGLFYYERYKEWYDTQYWDLGARTYLANRYNVAVYGKMGGPTFSTNFIGAYQFGTYDTGLANLINGNDLFRDRVHVSALLGLVEFALQLRSEPRVQFRAGVDFTSGDDGSSDKITQYRNEFYSKHLFRGNMEYFTRWTEYDSKGLIDVYSKLRYEPSRKWEFEIVAHAFSSVKNMARPGWVPNYPGRALGTELDLNVSTRAVRGMMLEGGLSMFLPTDRFTRKKNPDTGFWGYFMSTADF